MLDVEKENKILDSICEELDVPKTQYAPMEVVAQYLAVSLRQARNLCHSGFLGEKYGHRNWIVTRDELISFKPNKPGMGRPRKRI